MLKVEVDGTGKRFVDVPTLKGEHVRATFVPKDDPKSGYKVDSLRLRVRRPDGLLKSPGTDVPLSSLEEFLEAVNLLR